MIVRHVAESLSTRARLVVMSSTLVNAQQPALELQHHNPELVTHQLNIGSHARLQTSTKIVRYLNNLFFIDSHFEMADGTNPAVHGPNCSRL